MVIYLKKLISFLFLGAILLSSCRQPGLEKVVENLDFPEGPAWDGKGNIYLSNCHGGWIAKIKDQNAIEFLKASKDPFTFIKTNGLTIRKDGFIFACEYGIGAILRIHPNGKSEIYVKSYQDSAFNRPNDLAFDAMGGLYFTDPKSYDPDNPDGYVYYTDSEKNVKRVAGPMAFPNGIAINPDHTECFICESAKHRIVVMKIQEDGYLNFDRILVDFEAGDPDGIAFDRAGSLYVALYGGGGVFIINPAGEIINKIETPGANPTNVEFGGTDLKTLFITETETNALYKIKMKIAGLPLYFSPMVKSR
jgi:gluconolactonase